MPLHMRVVDGYVVDLSTNPQAEFSPSVAAEFIPVPEGAPDNLRFGYQYDGETFTSPPEAEAVEPLLPEPEPFYRTLVSVARFKAQFSLDAQIKIAMARSYAPVDPANPDMEKAVAKAGLDVLFGTLADLNQANTPIDVTDPAVVAGLDWMASQGFITSDDATRIKRGIEVTA